MATTSTATSAQYQTQQGSSSASGDAEMRLSQQQWMELLRTQPQRFRVVDTYQTGGTSGEYGDVAATVGTVLFDGKPVGKYDQGYFSTSDDMPDGQGGSQFTSFRAPMQMAADGTVQSFDVSNVDFRKGERENRGNDMGWKLAPLAVVGLGAAAGAAGAGGASAGTAANVGAAEGAAEFGAFQAADMAGSAAVPASGGAAAATPAAAAAVPAATTAATPTATQAAGAATTAAGAAGGGGGGGAGGGVDRVGSDWASGDPSAMSSNTSTSSSIFSDPRFQQLAARFGPAVAASMLGGSSGTLGLFQGTPEMQASANAANDRQTALSTRLQELGLDQFAQGQAFIDKYTPVYDQITQANLAQGANAGQLSSEMMGQYRSAFAPLANKYAQAVDEFGNDQAVRDAATAASVQKQADAAQASQTRQLAQMGVDPSSGRSIQGGIDIANKTALSKVGLINADRANTRLQKVNVLGQGVQTGNSVAGMGLQAGNQALNANQGATSTIGANSLMRSSALNPGTNLLGQASNANMAQVNAGTSRYNAEAAAQGNAFRTNLGTLGTIGGVIGSLYSSSEEKKTDIQPVDGERALTGLRKVPVKSYQYKAGEGDGGQHVGPMAEAMQQQFGDEVAPGGKALDIPSQFGLHHAAIQALDQKIDKVARLMKVGALGNAEDIGYRETPTAGMSLRSLRM